MVATLAAALLLPRTPTRPAGRLDVAGALRLSPGVLLLVLALAQAEGNATPISPGVVVPLIAGVLLLADFVRHAWRHEHPLLDLRLLTRRRFAFGALSLFCIDVAWFGMFLLVPLYLQQVRHLSPSAVGLLLAPEGIGSVAGLWRAGRIQDRVRARYVGLGGVGAFILTTIVFILIGPAGSYWIIVPAIFVSGVAAGLAWVPATAAGYLDLAPEKISDASSLVSVTMRLGASFGTALAAIALQRGLEVRQARRP